jgi:cysteine desulfurase
MNKIYFDNNATTPVDPAARDAMLPYLEDRFGNPSSAHRVGEAANLGVETARQQVADLLATSPARIFFTGCGSEANNMAIFSAAFADPAKKHLVSSVVEHASVLQPLAWLAGQGFEIELLEVDENGLIDLDRLGKVIRDDTALVSLMGANNETGILWPLEKIGAICRERGSLFHSDVVQMLGKEKIDAGSLPVDYLSMAAHKLYGPKGVGALYVSRTAPLIPLIHGAGQEKGKRAGTENTSGLAGFGMACQLAAGFVADYRTKLLPLRDRLEEGIMASDPQAMIMAHDQERLANTVNVCFQHSSSAGLIQELDERSIAVSGHSACHSGDLDPSHVLSAMQVPENYLHGSLRISLSHNSTIAEVERFLELLPDIVRKTRQDFAA